MAKRGKGWRSSADERPYGRYAFLNPYNLSLIAGVGATAAATGHWWMAVCGAAAEGIWMLFAPDSKILQQVWFDKIWDEKQKSENDERRRAKFKQISLPDQSRFGLLVEQRRRIEQLATDNPSMTTELLSSELPKLEALLDDFLELALTCTRAETHLRSFDFPQMERSWQMYKRQVDDLPPRDPRREVAKKNVEVLKQRRQRWDDLQKTLQTSRGQMDLMEQTFKLLGDDIVTASPQELGGRIDELRLGVDAIRATSVDAGDADAFAELEEAEEEADRARNNAR